MIDPTALREAVINAIVHNDYSNEVPPKFELFLDRLEITSAGGLPHGLSKDEFLMGFSVPRNKELMRVFKDLDLVEYLGSGIPRILKKYDPSIFLFTENFFRITFMFEEAISQTDFKATTEVNAEVTKEVGKLLAALVESMTRQEIQEKMHLKHDEYFRKAYLKPALEEGLIEMTIPNKPNSRLQKYRLTEKGKNIRQIISED